ncbi:hypothetical protein Pint_04783 [Pistacia integerrima]|uniref:Uncharacterized protein n=1 Tax=Pistacia integerrima TaxID=434235 RepID=A0ACC0Z924_9ROSI|nr:hypothetical protein Pint_04783 [Pistacia integerrima]
MNDDVLAVVVSLDAKYIATALLDCTVKILGLDFGDCHKSMFAHADSVMAMQFVRNTHYMFSVGKDRLIKYWDADKFELLLTLEGHHPDVWCLAISNRGDFIVTGSHDRSIRRWDRTEEPFFINGVLKMQEEKEKRLEEMFESNLDNAIENSSRHSEEELDHIAQHEEEKTRGNVAEFQPDIRMLGLSPSDYVLRTLSNVNTNDLEQTLLALPFADALKLLLT